MQAIEKLKKSDSIASFEAASRGVDVFLESFESDLAEELNRVIDKSPILGEGRTSLVFELVTKRTGCPVCLKVWRPEMTGMDIIDIRKMQTADLEEEFDVQDYLFLRGFSGIPRPLVFGEIRGIRFIAMEKIKGYTLGEISESTSKINTPGWRELEKMVKDLHKLGVVHRDINPGNVMIKTDKVLEKNSEVGGEIVLIDFGLSKRIFDSSPSEQDYKLTLGQEVIVYKDDFLAVDELSPERDGSPFIKR